MAFDHYQTVVLVTLDQSAAFDCVEHNTLLKRLHHTFGITDNALDWLQSYLLSRQFFVRYGQYDSSVSTVEVGVCHVFMPCPSARSARSASAAVTEGHRRPSQN